MLMSILTSGCSSSSLSKPSSSSSSSSFSSTTILEVTYWGCWLAVFSLLQSTHFLRQFRQLNLYLPHQWLCCLIHLLIYRSFRRWCCYFCGLLDFWRTWRRWLNWCWRCFWKLPPLAFLIPPPFGFHYPRYCFLVPPRNILLLLYD